MFKVGDKGKTVGGWDYEIINGDGSNYPHEAKHNNQRYDRVDTVWHKPDGRICCNTDSHGSDDWDLLPPESHEEVEMPEYSTIDTSYGQYSLTELLIFAAEAARDNPDCTFYVDAEAGTINVHAD